MWKLGDTPRDSAPLPYAANRSTLAVHRMQKSRKTTVLSVRLSADVKHRLQRAAKNERRSLTNMLEVAVLEYCDRRKPVEASRG